MAVSEVTSQPRAMLFIYDREPIRTVLLKYALEIKGPPQTVLKYRYSSKNHSEYKRIEELLQRKVYVFAKDYENKPFFLCNSVQ